MIREFQTIFFLVRNLRPSLSTGDVPRWQTGRVGGDPWSCFVHHHHQDAVPRPSRHGQARHLQRQEGRKASFCLLAEEHQVGYNGIYHARWEVRWKLLAYEVRIEYFFLNYIDILSYFPHRLYYACKDWVWYKFYTMVKNESEKIIKKQKEEEFRKMMQVRRWINGMNK